MSKLGKHIRKLREDCGLSLRELARRAQISPTYLSRVENGIERNPREIVLRGLSKHLGCSSDLLLHLAGRIPEDVRVILLADPSFFQAVRDVRKQRLTGPQLIALLEKRKE